MAIRIAIPGEWTKRSDLVAAIRKASPGYVIAGKAIKHAESGVEQPFALEDHDPNLAANFAQLRYDSGLSDAELAAINSHPKVAWLADSLGMGQAQALLRWSSPFAAAGLGVCVVSASKVHTAGAWLQLARSVDDPEALWAAYVSLNLRPDRSAFYSSGMQHFELPDASLPGDLDMGEAGEILRAFNLHLLEDAPTLREGLVFQPFKEGTQLRIVSKGASPFPAGHVQHNPYGEWVLAR